VTEEELERLAEAAQGHFIRRTRSLSDFRYDETQAKYWDVTTGILLKAESVNGAIPRDQWPVIFDDDGEPRQIAPAKAINSVETGLTVEGSTWWPGMPQFIEDTVVTEAGAQKVKGAVTYNRFIPNNLSGLRTDARPDPWVQHVKRLFPDENEHNHFFDWAAHLIQKPEEKVNHGIVLAGAQGIGKDTALAPLRFAVGEWNAAEIGPEIVTSGYNPFVKSLLVVINEVRPHDADFKAYNFYSLLKPILAAPPDMLPLNLKYANIVHVRNVCRVILTTNDPMTMFIPEDDRRLFVMKSDVEPQKKGDEEYFKKLHSYLKNGGLEAVAIWLMNRDISSFNPTAHPPLTKGKQLIIESTQEVRRGPVDDFLDALCEERWGGEWPDVIFQSELLSIARSSAFDDAEHLFNLIRAKNFHFKMADRGYHIERSPYSSEWKRGAFRSRVAFVHKRVPTEEIVQRVKAALVAIAEDDDNVTPFRPGKGPKGG
jgi:hypothetical protein